MRIVKLNAALTAIFVVVTVLAVVVFNSPLRRLVAIVDLLLFAIGVATFIWGYFSAVQRSRSDEISVAGLFLPACSAKASPPIKAATRHASRAAAQACGPAPNISSIPPAASENGKATARAGRKEF